MASGVATSLERDLDLIAGSGSVVGMSDAELLDRFSGRRGPAAEVAFEAIVAKHGPMVLGVCQAVLRNSNDADDAFQATFLVLFKKAGSLRVADSLAPWLYTVARRVAFKARAAALKRQARETPMDDSAEKSCDADREARSVLFDELDRLPEKYRSPVILCHLEGLSHEEAARRLRWPIGTLSGRLSRARDLLRARLTRRGLGVSTALGAAVFPPMSASAVPPTLLRSTVQYATTFAAGGTIPNSILFLMEGVLSAMLFYKLKSAAIAAAALTTLAVTAGYVSGQIGGTPPTPNQKAPGLPGSKSQPQEVPKPARIDQKLVPTNPKSPFRIPFLYSGDIIAVAPKDGRSVNAMVVELGVWHEYRAPEGVSLFPVLTPNVLALMSSGDDVREIAAFSTSPLTIATANPRGRWVRQPLRQPTKGKVWPIVSQGLAYYKIDGDVYAFSAATNGWDTLHLDQAEDVKVAMLTPPAILVEHGQKLYVFSGVRGKWSEGLKVPSPSAEGASSKPAG